MVDVGWQLYFFDGLTFGWAKVEEPRVREAGGAKRRALTKPEHSVPCGRGKWKWIAGILFFGPQSHCFAKELRGFGNLAFPPTDHTLNSPFFLFRSLDVAEMWILGYRILN